MFYSSYGFNSASIAGAGDRGAFFLILATKTVGFIKFKLRLNFSLNPGYKTFGFMAGGQIFSNLYKTHYIKPLRQI